MATYGESGRPNYSENFTPTTQNLLDHGFHTTDLRNYERHCERGEIRYSRDTNTFSQKEHFGISRDFRKIQIGTIEDMKAHVWAMDEREI